MIKRCFTLKALIALLFINLFFGLAFSQSSSADNDELLFQVIDCSPVKLQNRKNNTIWNLDKVPLYDVISVFPGSLASDFSLSVNDEQQADLSLTVTNTSSSAVEVTVNFPVINGIHLSPNRGDQLYYLYPKEGWAANNEDADEENIYGRWFPLQFVDIYDHELGGFYVMTQDQSNYPKKYAFKKKNGKIDFKVTHQTRVVQPGETWRLPNTVIGTHDGDWHNGFNAYKKWVNSWYTPISPRKEWFEDVYNFRQVFLHTIFGEEGMWNPDTKEIDLVQYIRNSEEAFGGVDYVHIFDWMREPEDRIFDYKPWNYLGGHEQLKSQISALQNEGINVGLYYQGYKVQRESEMGKKYGESWQMVDPQGNDYGERNYYYPCSSSRGWQDYLTGVARDITNLLGTDGVYFDQYGFGYLRNYFGCYSHEHDHPTIEGPVSSNYVGIGETQMLDKLRSKIGDGRVTYVEEMPTDVSTQYLDGSYTYAINKSKFNPSKNPSSVNLFRFIFPQFKLIELLAVDRPFDDEVVMQLKKVFFNGEGVFLQGPLNDSGWFSDMARYTIRKTHSILSSNKEAFRSGEAVPLVETLNDEIHANYFPSPRKNVWTLFNVGDQDFTGSVLKIPHIEGAHYYDAWNLNTVYPRFENGYAIVVLSVAKEDAGCLIQSLDPLSIDPPAPLTITKKDPKEKISMTTNKDANSVISFKVSAGGTGDFYIDWGDGKLIQYDVSNSYNKPTEITGKLAMNSKTIKLFTKDRYITYLNLNALELTELNVGNEPMLSFLHCMNNQLTNIDVSKNKELLMLMCQSNNLTSLDVTENFKLKDLQINGNKISILLGLDSLYALKTLITAGCPITHLELSKNPNLVMLNVRNSGLSTLDFTNNIDLTTVDIVNEGPTNANNFSAGELKKLFKTLPDRSNEKEPGVIRVVYSESNPIFNEVISIANNKNWDVFDASSNKID